MSMADDEDFMRLALEQARLGMGLTSPNPAVGAVLVNGEGRVIGKGWHRKAGLAHAEVEALRDAEANGEAVEGATAYVTLEPCSTHGRTGACTDALRNAGVTRVVYGARDPNPAHAGMADEVLRGAGMEVISGVLKEECDEVIRPFAKWITTGLPYVMAKCGQSLDGRITRPEGESQWITSELSRSHAMGLRVRCDAILVGGETLRRDDPRLTLRGEAVPEGKVQPWRVVVTRSGDLPHGAKVFTDEWRERTMVLKGEFSFGGILQELATRGVMSVLLECGGNLMGQAFAERVVDEVCWYVAPRFCGETSSSVGGVLPGSVRLERVRHLSLGEDVLVSGVPVWE
ncbi:bifunctional diaminohydroxyphosphoribosylaminopyrimidine deaminase/5-amino-6-(5-phosphoribosylamino)uracil reductase RibD [Phragmitibacter flavus]|uniref:Riboflavin biosynthesis protein RibD n=1 Tax=Phragmitibacter flavus TaxID=2576071 RepID=A0A5R8KGR0_9BACT|nr:bifunctional diaminohydroxyphosphoribosylaminopyrimidine deaminase/5-amino-6-(5-phosphoribosylamino)uracil reductase RibD [Phragmitibacter flavus]TLD71498.1 bifunctional diaminohydroxyphosphoribosylaminopyrimidine deaminase/5-amino-6-(5-phosphoribosylamino)uracil reductase RibD [Phragmitibacter flavus]